MWETLHKYLGHIWNVFIVHKLTIDLGLLALWKRTISWVCEKLAYMIVVFPRLNKTPTHFILFSINWYVSSD